MFSYLGIRTKEAARDDASGAQDTPIEKPLCEGAMLILVWPGPSVDHMLMKFYSDLIIGIGYHLGRA